MGSPFIDRRDDLDDSAIGHPHDRNPDTSPSDLSTIAANRPLGFSRRQSRYILRHLDEEEWCESRDGWLKVGAALHHEHCGDDEGLEIWDWFSESSDKFDASDSERVWKSFKPRRDPITMATLLAAAKQSSDWDDAKYKGQENEAERKSGGLIYLSSADLGALESPFDFVRGVLHDGQLSVMFGPPGSGKSFFALDMAAHVALGRPVNAGEKLHHAAGVKLHH